MDIKFAEDIVREIKKRGEVSVPEGYVTGEEHEKWMREDKKQINKRYQ